MKILGFLHEVTDHAISSIPDLFDLLPETINHGNCVTDFPELVVPDFELSLEFQHPRVTVDPGQSVGCLLLASVMGPRARDLLQGLDRYLQVRVDVHRFRILGHLSSSFLPTIWTTLCSSGGGV